MSQLNNNSNKTNFVKVLSIVSILTLVIFSSVQVVVVKANHSELGETVSYGTMNLFHEDKLFVNYGGDYYFNTLQNNEFELVDYIISEYSIDGAIDVFNVYEDTQEFIIEPKFNNNEWSDILVLYKLNEQTLNFELTNIYEDESGIDQFVTQLENTV